MTSNPTLGPETPDSKPRSARANRSRLPPWIRVRVSSAGHSEDVERLLAHHGLHTVCRSAECPNRPECYGKGTATFMILGGICTRRCAFCAVKSGQAQAPDPEEPRRVAAVAAELGLRHVVITSVTRDDLPDGGAGIFAACIEAVRARLPQSTVEVLTPDFKGDPLAIATVMAAGPDVFNHNLETVRRLQRVLRPAADYDRSLAVLRLAADRPESRVRIKSGLMLGLGETEAELDESLRDLRRAGCELLTLGQYLAPSDGHTPVVRFVPPAEFDDWGSKALALGFTAVASGPLVRSSYRAGDLLSRA